MDFYSNGSLWDNIKNGYVYPMATKDPGSIITLFPDRGTELSFNSTNMDLSLVFPIFTQLLDADRELFVVPCVYPLSGQYNHLPRILFYIMIIFAILLRHRTTIAEAALSVVIIYSATACIHLFVLLGFYKFSIPDSLDSIVEDATMYGDVDFWGIAIVVAVSAIVLIPILIWSDSFKGDRGKAVLICWSILIFVSFSIVCYYATTYLESWYISVIPSVASCLKDCPRPRSRENTLYTLWNVEDYTSDSCDCVDYCGLLSPKSPLRAKQGMVPLLYYKITLNYLCEDRNCTNERDSGADLVMGVVIIWLLPLYMGLLAMLSVNSSSESVRNTIFQVANASLRDIIIFMFKGRRQNNVLEKLGLRSPHDPHTLYRQLRRFVAKLAATLYYGLAFFGLVASLPLFIISVVVVEIFLGSFATSERSDAVGSWAPWVAAVLVLLAPAIMRVNTILSFYISKIFGNIRNLIQYDREERSQRGQTEKQKPEMGSLISITHVRYVKSYSWWYLTIRAKSFIEWWKNPEAYSTKENCGYGMSDE